MKVLACDVNETMLDLVGLDPVFHGFFGSPLVRQQWFQETLKNAFVSTITGYYEPFPKLARAALETVEQRQGRTLTEAEREQIASAMLKLPAHADVAPGLKRAAAKGYTVVALGNNLGTNIEAQLRHAGIWDHFRHIFGTETVQRMKPAKEPYQFVARTMGCDLADITMVACHAWDLAGAQAAGLSAAFIARPGQYLDSLTPKPRFTAQTFTDLADQLPEDE